MAKPALKAVEEPQQPLANFSPALVEAREKVVEMRQKVDLVRNSLAETNQVLADLETEKLSLSLQEPKALDLFMVAQSTGENLKKAESDLARVRGRQKQVESELSEVSRDAERKSNMLRTYGLELGEAQKAVTEAAKRWMRDDVWAEKGPELLRKAQEALREYLVLGGALGAMYAPLVPPTFWTVELIDGSVFDVQKEMNALRLQIMAIAENVGE